MTQDTYDAGRRAEQSEANVQPAPLSPLAQTASHVLSRMLEIAGFVGLIGIGILLAGLLAQFFFGSSVTTAL